MSQIFVPGRPARLSGPLARFLPPVENGAVEALLEPHSPADVVIVDPFGTSPHLVSAAARAGFGVLVAVNNPVTRHILLNHLRPPALADLQAALAELAQLPKDDGRLEAFLDGLYQSRCADCGSPVTADYFIWDDDLHEPYLKGYACSSCNRAGEDETTDEDRRLARSFERRDLSWAQALEAVAPAGDPDRPHAEAALGVYPGRARYALVALVNKLGQLGPSRPVGLDSLLLSAFDTSDSMWAYPEGRPRPRQLSASPRFREFNVWRALERAVTEWDQPHAPIPVVPWPGERLPQPGEVGVFSGSARELAATLPGELPAVVLTSPPRPNQAFWTLSALWAAWLWGREAAQPIKAALRRRRYDWAWHAGALQIASRHVVDALPAETPWITLVPEAEPGYLAAVMSGLDAAGLGLLGWAVRVDDAQAQLTWRKRQVPSLPGPLDLTRLADDVVRQALQARAEPSPYLVLHAAVGADWATKGVYRTLWEAEGGQPVASLNLALETALGSRSRVVRLDQRQEIESGLFWLTLPSPTSDPLADRVEHALLGALRLEPVWDGLALDRWVCGELNGLATPDRGLVLACLDSYALETEPGRWALRPEDQQSARGEDLLAIQALLLRVGDSLGYTVSAGPPLIWQTEPGETAFTFLVHETASMRTALAAHGAGLTLVIPGGRSALLEEKARRDPRLAERLASGLHVIKFRHVRRLAEDTALSRDNIADRLLVDPPEHEDPQLPLL